MQKKQRTDETVSKFLPSLNNHVTCLVEMARFEFRTLGTKAERYDYCATRPVCLYTIFFIFGTLDRSLHEQEGVRTLVIGG